MIKGDHDWLERLCKFNRCKDHPDAELVVAWHPEKCWVIRCGAGHYPDVLQRQLSPTEQYRAGDPVPLAVEHSIKRGRTKRMVDNVKRPEELGRALIPREDLGSGQALTEQQVSGLIAYARRYSLDPFRGHVVLMYSKPYITIDGYLYHARRTNTSYKLESRPLSAEERSAFQVPEGDHAWVAEVTLIPSGATFSGRGVVTQEEMAEESRKKPGALAHPVVAAKPWQLAQKRAEWQALRRAFPIGEGEDNNKEA